MTIYYAAQSPRGFSNEVNVYRFSDKQKRDAWVAEHGHDGDVNGAAMGAYTITQKEARKLVGWPLNSQEAAMFMGDVQ
jgi:hypothetical protein